MLHMAVTRLANLELSKHSLNHENLFCFVYFTLVYCKSSCLSNTFFFLQQMSSCSGPQSKQWLTVWKPTGLPPSVWPLQTLSTYIYKHKQTATATRAKVHPFDPVWLLNAVFYTTERNQECEWVSERQGIRVISLLFKTTSSLLQRLVNLYKVYVFTFVWHACILVIV